MIKVNQRVCSRARTKTISPNSVLIFILLFYMLILVVSGSNWQFLSYLYLLYKIPYTLLQLYQKKYISHYLGMTLTALEVLLSQFFSENSSLPFFPKTLLESAAPPPFFLQGQLETLTLLISFLWGENTFPVPNKLNFQQKVKYVGTFYQFICICRFFLF